MPPTTTVASGRCTWLPIPVEIAAGNKPMQADSVVRFAGEPVAAVVAGCEAEAEDLADLVEVDIAEAPALHLTGLTKRYDDGFLALDGFDLTVPAGEFFGLLGPNGAGKTTLISAVCSLIRTTGGTIEIFGHDHRTLHARKLVGLAEQDVNLDRFLDVEETLVYHGGYFGMSRAHARRRAKEMMDVFDLSAKATVRAPKLSGGMRRRLLLARGLVHDPELVLLDEPTVGLDPQIRTQLWTLIDDLRSAGVDFLTVGQYLQPTRKHAAIDRFWTPDEFKALETIAYAKGFLMVSASPLTRSSHHAGEDFARLKAARQAAAR